LKWLKLSPRLVSRESLHYVIHFGGLVQFQSMLSIFLASVERVAALTFMGAETAGLMDVAKKWPSSLSTIPTAFFAALLPAASHVEAASRRHEALANLRVLYLRATRHSNLCTSAFVAVLAFWAAPLMHVWLGPAIPVKGSLISLFVVFSLTMQMHMLTGTGTSIFRGMGRVYEEFTYSIPNLLLLAVMLPLARWVEGRWTALGIGVAVCAATVLAAFVLMARVFAVLKLRLGPFLREVIVPGITPYLVAGALAWPVAHYVAMLTRWQGAAVIGVAGTLYSAGVLVVLFRWVLTETERRQVSKYIGLGLGFLGAREATA
jgi:O-antigen/teichoic acid export membrane protein